MLIRVCNMLEVIGVVGLTLLIGPTLIITGIGWGVSLTYFLIQSLPYLLAGALIWLIVKKGSNIFHINKDLPNGAYEVAEPPKPLWTMKYQGKDIPIGVVIFSVLLTVILLPIIVIALFFLLPWYWLAGVILAMIVSRFFKKGK